MELLKRIAEGVVGGDEKQVAQLTGQAIEQSTSPKLILDDGLIAGMNVVGRRFKEHEIFLPDVLLAARAMYAGMDLLKRHMAATLAKNAQRTNRFAVLRYSPGYCGWHVSGQGKLFDYLRPERIGLSLRTSFLMEPLKSVSGVLVAGPKEIHEFSASYDFCSRCDTRGCRQRIRTLCEEEYVVET